MNSPLVWVTRPQLNNKSTITKLENLGFKPLVAPLMSYHWMPYEREDGGSARDLLLNADACVVTSQAIFAANWDEESISTLQSKKMFCVGAKTAHAAKDFGIKNITIGPGNGVALGHMLIKDYSNAHSYRNLLYITGTPRRDGFENLMVSSSFNLSILEVYQSIYAEKLPEIVESPWCSGDIQVVLLYSEQAAQCFLSCISALKLKIGHKSKINPIILCLSHDVAKSVLHKGLNVKIAEQPNEESLFDLL